MVFLMTKRLLKKLIIIVNGCWLTFRLNQNYQLKEKRKKDLDIKCKHILKKNPEILHYFGSINKIHMTNLNESNFNFFQLDLLNSVEFLIEGKKRTGKVSIRYYLTNPAMLKDIVKKQSDYYESLLIIKNEKYENDQDKDIYQFNYKNILKPQNPIHEGSKSIMINDTNNNLNFSVSDIEKKRSNVLLHNVFNFYYLNQATNSAALKDFEISKINELESFYNKYRKFLEEKFNFENDKNNKLSEQQVVENNKEMFLPLFNYFKNYLVTKSNKDDQVDILIQDIFIKKNFRYYSITPQNYDSKEYIIDNTKYIKDDNSTNNSDTNQNKDLNVFKIASEFIKEKTIVNQHNEISKTKDNTIRKNNPAEANDFDYDYNYSFIEEIYDGIQMDWRINYMIFCTIFVVFYFIIYSISQQKNFDIFEMSGRKIIKYVKANKGYNLSNSHFFYFLWRSPMLIHSERYLKISIIDPATIEKFRTTFVINQMNVDIQIIHQEQRSNENPSKDNIKI